MSSRARTIAVNQEEYAWEHEDLITLSTKDLVQGKLLDANVICLLVLGLIPIIVGLAANIWPIALAAPWPWLLAWLDIRQRRRGKKH